MTAPDTIRVNDQCVTIAPHSWTTVSREFYHKADRSRLRRVLDALTFRPSRGDVLIVSVRIRVPVATDMQIEMSGPHVRATSLHRRIMGPLDVQS